MLKTNPELVEAKAPHFDCRVWNVPDRAEAANTIFWRFLDARKNAVSSFTRAHISHKKMHGLNTQEQIDAVRQAGGPDYDDAVESKDRFGRTFYRTALQRRLTDDEWQAIPEAHRPHRDACVTRTAVVGRPVDWANVDRVSMLFGK